MKAKQYLEANNFKQVWVAKQLGIRPSQLSGWVNGWIPLPNKYHQQMANLLGVSIAAVEANDFSKEGK